MVAAWVSSRGAAHADSAKQAPPSVLVIATQAEEGSAEAKVLASVREAVGALDAVELLPPAPLDLEAVQLAIDCSDESAECFGEIATRMQAQIVIVPALKRRSDSLELHIKLFDKRTGAQPTSALRKQAGTRLDETLLEAVPGMVRELLQLEGEGELTAEPKASESQPALAPAPADGGDPTSGSSGAAAELPLGPIVLAGSGLSLVVGGLVVGAIASSTEDDYASRTIDTVEQAKQADEVRKSGEREALAANLLLGTGAAVIVASVLWYVLDPPSESTPQGARLLPVVGPSSAGLVFAGTWRSLP